MNPKHVEGAEKSAKSAVATEFSAKMSKEESTKESSVSKRTVRKDQIVKPNNEKSARSLKSPTKQFSVVPRLKRPDPTSTPLMPIDEKFRKRWHIEGIIGKGGYGEIYLAIDMKLAEEVAIKAEPLVRKGKIARRMILEQAVLVKLQGKPHVPWIFGSGHTENFNFIVLQLLSANLGDIRRMSPTRKLSKSSVGRIAVQAIAALRDLHDVGYLHRDIKPGNMCFGITSKTRHVLMLLDFGLVRRYKDPDGEWRTHRVKAGFRGTQRYVSTRVHRRLEQTPTDDMVSLLYTLIELLAGELPWRNIENSDAIWKMKDELHHGQIDHFHESSQELIEFSQLVSRLDPMSELPYTTLQASVKKLYLPKKLSDPYDWEENFKDALLEKPRSTEDSS